MMALSSFPGGPPKKKEQDIYHNNSSYREGMRDEIEMDSSSSSSDSRHQRADVGNMRVEQKRGYEHLGGELADLMSEMAEEMGENNNNNNNNNIKKDLSLVPEGDDEMEEVEGKVPILRVLPQSTGEISKDAIKVAEAALLSMREEVDEELDQEGILSMESESFHSSPPNTDRSLGLGNAGNVENVGDLSKSNVGNVGNNNSGFRSDRVSKTDEEVKSIIQDEGGKPDTWMTKIQSDERLSTIDNKSKSLDTSILPEVYSFLHHISDTLELFLYDLKTMRGTSTALEMEPFTGFDTVIHENRIYITGGSDNYTVLKTMSRVTIMGKETALCQLSEMNYNKMWHASAYFPSRHEIYTFGGYNNVAYLDACERYDIGTDTWNEVEVGCIYIYIYIMYILAPEVCKQSPFRLYIRREIHLHIRGIWS